MPLKAVCQGRAFGTSAKPISPLTDWRGLLHCHQEVIPPTVISSPAPYQPIPLRSIAGNEKPQNPTKIQESPLSCFSPHFVEKHAGQGHDRYLFSSENRIYQPCKRGDSPPSLTYPLHGSTGRSYAPPLRSVLPAILRGVWGAFAPQFEMPESDINIE